MANVLTANSITALQAAAVTTDAVVYLSAAGREGEFNWRPGDYTAAVASDPQRGLYVPSSSPSFPASTGCWVRQWDGAHGRPEWFGAIPGTVTATVAAANLTALNACHALCQVMVLSDATYQISDTFYFSGSHRRLVGSGTSADSNGGSTLMLVGTYANLHSVFQLGGSDLPNAPRWQRVEGVNFTRSATASPSPTGNALECVKSVVILNTTNSTMSDCRAFNSPVGFHILHCVAFNFLECNTAPATSTSADFSIGLLLGSYEAAPGGFVGSNASIRVEAFNAHYFPTATYSACIRLFGYVADTWLERCEGSHGLIGIDIDGADRSGAIIQAGGSCQDVYVSTCRMDGFTSIGFSYHDLGPSASVQQSDHYASSCGTSISLSKIGIDSAGTIQGGSFRISGGESLAGASGQTGLTANMVGSLSVEDALLRDYSSPVVLAQLGMARVQPQIQNNAYAASTAIALTAVFRSIVSPQLRGGTAKFTLGIAMDSASKYNEIDGSAINPGAFTTVDKQYKVRFNGQDASSGAGATAFTAAGNVLVGVTG